MPVSPPAIQPTTHRETEPSATPSELAAAILRALLYADLFDYPMRAEEIHRQLLLVPASLAEVTRCLERDPWLTARIARSDALYFLPGRAEVCARRAAQAAGTDTLIAQHLTALRILSAMPYVRMVAFSGGTSRKNSIQDDDLDLFIVAEKGRAWAVYALLVAVARALGCRDVICANYLVDRVHISVPDGGDLFTGQELMALKPLVGRRWLREVVGQNAWVEQLMPNAQVHAEETLWRSLPAEPLLRRGVELGLWPQLWLLERGSRALFGRRIRKKAAAAGQPDVLLRPGILKLHTTDNRGLIVTRYRDALARAGLLDPTFERLLGKRLRTKRGDRPTQNGTAQNATAQNAAAQNAAAQNAGAQHSTAQQGVCEADDGAR